MARSLASRFTMVGAAKNDIPGHLPKRAAISSVPLEGGDAIMQAQASHKRAA